MWNAHGGRGNVAPAVMRAWHDSGVFESVEGLSRSNAIVETGLGAIVKPAVRVTPGLFPMLGVRPLVGRGFDAAEGRPGTDDRVILSEGLWRSAFGADRAILGRAITIDGARAYVVGVMPASFRFPDWNTAVWRPMDFSARPPALAAARPEAIVTLAAGIPPADALRRATAAARAVDPQITSDMQATARPIAGGALDANYWRILPALFGGVALVFAVLCANVCSLLLAGMTARRREVQVRAALGASRRRLFTQAISEHAVIGANGAAAGVAVAWVLVALSRALLPEAFLLRTLHPVDLDVRALIVAAATGLAATIAAGLLPAWIGTRPDTSMAFDSGRGATQSKAARRVTNGLLVSEVAVACALLIGAALLVRSFVKLSTVDRGLRTKGVLIAWISLPAKDFADRASRLAANDTVERAVREIPGVTRVALSYGVPPSGAVTHYNDDWRGDEAARPQTATIESYYVGADFFDLYEIPILRGQTFRAEDANDAAVVSERLAALLWPGRDPVGHRFSFGDQHLSVVGVAREIRFPSLDADRDVPEFYVPFRTGASTFFVSLKCAPRCPSEASVRQTVMAAVPQSTVERVVAPETAYVEELARPRATAALATVFGVIAALAVAGGLFSVLTFAVAARQRELGIRAAIGASPRALRSVVYSDAARVGGVGLVVGLMAAVGIARGLGALMYGVAASDWRSWSAVILVLIATIAAACWRPARTAANADPVTLLRTE